jgi:3-hydroxypropionyl-coenzyme A dehydratase
MAFSAIETRVSGARGELVLNRPQKLNALDHRALVELVEAARWFDQQPDVKVVVVSGNGRSFSAGADVSAFAAEDPGPERRRAGADAGRLMAEAIEHMSAVTVARIHGHCVGGAVVLAAACDLRVACETAVFSIPEVELGIPLAWGGIPRLVREIGPAMTRELVLTCRRFSAAEARELRFLNRVVPEEQLEDAVDQLVGVLLEKSRLTLLATKRAVDAATQQMLATTGAWSDADTLMTALSDPESRRSAEAYLRRIAGRA